jgi:hypothetical protein
VQGPSLRHFLGWGILVGSAVLSGLAAYEAAAPGQTKNTGLGAVLAFGGELILAAVPTIEDWFIEDNAPPRLLVVGVEGFFSSVLSLAALGIASQSHGFEGSGIYENVKDTMKRLKDWKLITAVVGLAAAVFAREIARRPEADRGYAIGAVVQMAVVWSVQLVMGKVASDDSIGEGLSRWSIAELAGFFVAVTGLLVQGEVIKLSKSVCDQSNNMNHAPLISE